MKKGFCYVAAIVDRSSSMAPLTNETIQGFNNFLKDQKAVPGEAMMTLCTFADTSHFVYDGVPIAQVPELTRETYVARGNTALNDAVAETIDAVGKRLSAMREEDRPSQVIFLIITDGEENRSRKYSGEYGKNLVAQKIRHQREKYSWEFVFIGANIDAVEVAKAYSINPQNAAVYTASSEGTSQMLRGMSHNMMHYRSSGAAVAKNGFFQEPIKLDDDALKAQVKADDVKVEITTNK